jgi:hypothetical protein
MARERSDKSKKTPLGKRLNEPKITTEQPDESVSTKAEASGRGISETSAQRPASTAQPTKPNRSKKWVEQQSPVDFREPEQSSAQTVSTSTPNGRQSIEDDSATRRRIAERAYILFQENGCEHGNDWFHWFEAERQIKEA